MEIVNNPDKKDWLKLIERPYANNNSVLPAVQSIIEQVRSGDDEALIALNKKFGGAELTHVIVSVEEIKEAIKQVPEDLKEALLTAKRNIEVFHKNQLSETETVETMPGIQCWRKNVPIEKIGLYIPGGSAPLFSTVLMLGVPATIAGCKEIVLCTPPDKAGTIHPAILYAANLVGITRIIKAGGAQAIAAMAFGTKSVPAVYKIFGPGNQYVTTAKQLVQMQGIAIDMPAGPSEVCVLADDSAIPSFIASDLLSQAEHGEDSQALLICTSKQMAVDTVKELDRQLHQLPRKAIALNVLKNAKAIVLDNMGSAIEVVNEYAPEHLIISCANAEQVSEKIINAGSVFIGNYSPESAGDYASGTNHTLPTNGFAKAYSGVSMDSFVKKITFQKLSREGLQGIASTVVLMASAENLEAHANAVRLRIES